MRDCCTNLICTMTPTLRVCRSRKPIEGDGRSNLLLFPVSSDSKSRFSVPGFCNFRSQLLLAVISFSKHEFIPIKALSPSKEISKQLMLQWKGSCALAIKTPLREKVLRVCCDLFQAITTPWDERQTAWASTPESLLIRRPLLTECKRISEEVEHETTTPRSELTQQQSISWWWPRRTCRGPSIRHLLLLSANMFDRVVLLVEVGAPVPVEGSNMLVEREVNALCILQSNTIVSLDPVTR